MMKWDERWVAPPQSTEAYLAGLVSNTTSGVGYSNTVTTSPKVGTQTFMVNT